jgi:hypothetical protein
MSSRYHSGLYYLSQKEEKKEEKKAEVYFRRK